MRPTWDEYFIKMTNVIAERATCDRKHVGAVIVKDKRPIATGYNGSIPGLPHCDDPEEFWYCSKCGNKTVETPRYVPGQGHICEKDIACLGRVMKKLNGGHDMDKGHCVRTIHAEVNAITQAARLGISTEGATLYCNTFPCWQCFKSIVAAGISEVVYQDDYRSHEAGRVTESAKKIPGFVLRKFTPKTNN